MGCKNSPPHCTYPFSETSGKSSQFYVCLSAAKGHVMGQGADQFPFLGERRRNCNVNLINLIPKFPRIAQICLSLD